MTSIEWLEKEIWRRGPIGEDTPTWLKELYDQAKLLHKQEIIDAWNSAGGGDAYHQVKEYYQETFVSKGSDETPMERKLLKSGFVDIVPKQETLYTEEQVKEAIQKARHSYAVSNDIIQLLKQPKK